jgi:ferritin-like metal-binding protein YciE
MLACARIGAIHSVVFGGFSPDSLRDRINDAEAKLLITADAGYRRGQIIPLKRNADKAIEETPSIENVIVVQRRAGATGDESFAEMQEGRDHWWHRVMRGKSNRCEPEVMDAGLIGAAQKVEHYEIAGYGTVRTYAEMLGNDQAARLLQQTLDEEGMTDKKLNKLAMQCINVEAQ